MMIYITYVLKIQSFQSQEENCKIYSCATNLYSVWFHRAIMTYLVKNDSENSDFLHKTMTTVFYDVNSVDVNNFNFHQYPKYS